MEYGILVVEDDDMYQILGAVCSVEEARELARHYEQVADPYNPDACVPPTDFVIIRRSAHGYLTDRETLTLQ